MFTKCIKISINNNLISLNLTELRLNYFFHSNIFNPVPSKIIFKNIVIVYILFILIVTKEDFEFNYFNFIRLSDIVNSYYILNLFGLYKIL